MRRPPDCCMPRYYLSYRNPTNPRFPNTLSPQNPLESPSLRYISRPHTAVQSRGKHTIHPYYLLSTTSFSLFLPTSPGAERAPTTLGSTCNRTPLRPFRPPLHIPSRTHNISHLRPHKLATTVCPSLDPRLATSMPRRHDAPQRPDALNRGLQTRERHRQSRQPRRCPPPASQPETR
ncbi:hypothetical protein D3C80_1422910 [compost metagenome]